jgi:2-aminoadipate transaminase
MQTSTITSQGQTRHAQPAPPIQESAMREMFTMIMNPELLSFALGLPAPELFPLANYRDAAIRVLDTDPQALQYQVRPGPLKRHIQQLMASRGVNCREDQIFLTAGAQQATHLLVNLLLERGAQTLFEEVTYEGLHLALQPLRPQSIIAPTRVETGIDLDVVEDQLKRGARPAFIYTITDGHNPLGLSLSQAARIRLIELARRFRVPIVEDDVFGLLNYDGPALSPMRALDDEWVFYIGSFSKILAPALRVGWIVAPDAFKPSLSFLKNASDLDLTTFSQFTLSGYLDTGAMPDHLATLRREYGMRRDLMLRALESSFPFEARWLKPTCGMFIWVELPPRINSVELLRMAVETERVAFMPGVSFSPPGGPCARNGIRLNFTHCQPQLIEDGIARLARVLKRALARNG